MHQAFPSFATIGLGNQELIILVGMILALSVPIIAIVLIFTFRHQREKLWHETARLALEKGQPVPLRGPPASEAQMPPGAQAGDWLRWQRTRRRQKDIRNGIVLLAIGGALFLGDEHRKFYHGMTMGAFILIGLGLASLLNARWGRLDDDFRPPSA